MKAYAGWLVIVYTIAILLSPVWLLILAGFFFPLLVLVGIPTILLVGLYQVVADAFRNEIRR